MNVKFGGAAVSNTFIKQVSGLAGGTALAQAINLLSLPILTRLYSPSDFGVYALLGMAAAIAGVFVSFRYEIAILAVDTMEEAVDCVYLVMWLSLIGSSIILIGYLVFSALMPMIGSNSTALIVSIFFVLIFSANIQALYYLNNRKMQYKYMTKGRVYSALAFSLLSISYGYLYRSYEGLLIGSVAGAFINFIYLYIRTEGINYSAMFKSYGRVKEVAIKNIRFPKYLVPSSILDRFSSQFHVAVFSRYFGDAFTGALYLHAKVVSVPISLVGSAIGDVFKRNASEQLRSNGQCRVLFVKTAVTLFLLVLVPSVILMLFAPEIYVFVFGEEWALAGEFSQILAPVFALGFVVSPLSSLIYLESNQKYDLYLQLFLVVMLLVGISYAVINNSAYQALYAYAAAYIFKYLIEVAICWHISTGK
jgi:O-antigen/teichoic acid export membrane protein